MGGSILGAKAIYDFLKHKTKKNFIFIDNLDENYLKSIKKIIIYQKVFLLLFQSQVIQSKQSRIPIFLNLFLNQKIQLF